MPCLHDAVVDFHVFRVFREVDIADFVVSPGCIQTITASIERCSVSTAGVSFGYTCQWST